MYLYPKTVASQNRLRQRAPLSRRQPCMDPMGSIWRRQTDGCPRRVIASRGGGEDGVPGDLTGTADAWGTGFVDELNYADEKINAERFNADVARSSLAGSTEDCRSCHSRRRRADLSSPDSQSPHRTSTATFQHAGSHPHAVPTLPLSK